MSFTFSTFLRVQILLLGPFGLTLFELSQTKSNVTKRGNLHCLDKKRRRSWFYTGSDALIYLIFLKTTLFLPKYSKRTSLCPVDKSSFFRAKDYLNGAGMGVKKPNCVLILSRQYHAGVGSR